MLSLLAHAVVAAVFRILVFWQENPLDAREARLEFSVRAVQTRPASALRAPSKSHPDSIRTAQNDANPKIDSEQDTLNGEPSDQDFIPVGHSGRGPRWISGQITRADYPSIAAREGLEAIVRALVYVRRDGSVYRVKILKGHPAFDETVVRKLKTAVFSPALDRETGRPIAVRLILPIEFRLR